MAALAQPVTTELAIRNALAPIQPPEGVALSRVDFMNDWAGDPAIYVVFSLKEINQSDEERGQDLFAFSRKVRAALDLLDLPLFVYDTFEVA